MVGLGKMGNLAIKYLFESPFKVIYVAVRHPENLAIEVLEHPKVRIVSFEDRYAYIALSHLVITSTAAPHPIIKKSNLTAHQDQAIIIDLAVPRDVEPALYGQEGLTIWDVDALKEVSEENYQKRHDLIGEIETLIFDEVTRCLHWIDATKVDDLLKSWNKTISEVKDQTLTILGKKGAGQMLSDTLFIEKIVEASLKKMIKTPLENLKSMENSVKREQYIHMLKELYNYE